MFSLPPSTTDPQITWWFKTSIGKLRKSIRFGGGQSQRSFYWLVHFLTLNFTSLYKIIQQLFSCDDLIKRSFSHSHTHSPSQPTPMLLKTIVLYSRGSWLHQGNDRHSYSKATFLAKLELHNILTCISTPYPVIVLKWLLMTTKVLCRHQIKNGYEDKGERKDELCL